MKLVTPGTVTVHADWAKMRPLGVLDSVQGPALSPGAKPEPVTVTDIPDGPLVGFTVITGAAATGGISDC